MVKSVPCLRRDAMWLADLFENGSRRFSGWEMQVECKRAGQAFVAHVGIRRTSRCQICSPELMSHSCTSRTVVEAKIPAIQLKHRIVNTGRIVQLCEIWSVKPPCQSRDQRASRTSGNRSYQLFSQIVCLFGGPSNNDIFGLQGSCEDGRVARLEVGGFNWSATSS